MPLAVTSSAVASLSSRSHSGAVAARAAAALLMCDQVTRIVTGGTEAETVLAVTHAVKDTPAHLSVREEAGCMLLHRLVLRVGAELPLGSRHW